MYEEITAQARQALEELLEKAKLKAGDILVVGCSSSEMVGGTIGKNSSLEAAQALYQGLAPLLKEKGIWLAAQCCEHLNRCVILEAQAAQSRSWPVVNVLPQPHAGGSWATTCWAEFQHPVAVEAIQAQAGMDVGDTLIGMHLAPVAVPLRLAVKEIGQAHLVCARTRPKYIGGERAHYDPALE